jgi:hypothetical protein
MTYAVKPSCVWLRGALCVLALAACKPDDEPATQIIVSINSDLEIGAEITRVRVEIKSTSGSESSTPRTFNLSTGTPSGGRVRFPFSFGIQKGSAERVTVTATGFGPTTGGMEGAVVERKENVRFEEGEALLLKIFLDDTCLGNVCNGAETCQLTGAMAGDCAAIRELDLSPITPGDEDDAWDENGGGAGGQGGAGGEAGTSGEGGSSGEAGTSGEGGSSGEADTSGVGGSSGEAGTSGEGGSAGGPSVCDPPCDLGEQCVDLQCVCDGAYQTYYEDFDEDGYGDPNVTQEGCDNAPSGYVVNNADCCDTDDRVYPGATEPYDTPSNCGDGSDGNLDWDLDCSGTIEGVTALASGVCCDTTSGWSDGWVDTVPFCGQPGTLAVCDIEVSCEFETGDVLQRCL